MSLNWIVEIEEIGSPNKRLPLTTHVLMVPEEETCKVAPLPQNLLLFLKNPLQYSKKN